MNKEIALKWIKNTYIFLAPALLLFLVQIQAGTTWQDALIALKLWGLNTLIDLIRKSISTPDSTDQEYQKIIGTEK